MSAAAAALADLGFAAFTVDAVAERTGIAKTTIYRRWPTKAALLSAVADDAVPSTAETIEGLLGEIIAAMRLLRGSHVQTPDDASPGTHPESSLVEVLVPFIAARRARLIALLPPRDASAIADALAGALLLRFISRSGPIDDAFAQSLIRRTVGSGV